jgi:hypothetical protein
MVLLVVDLDIAVASRESSVAMAVGASISRLARRGS